MNQILPPFLDPDARVAVELIFRQEPDEDEDDEEDDDIKRDDEDEEEEDDGYSE